MKRIVVGVVAHVDAGKTTLSEAMLYTAGALRKAGRVDHGDAFLDTDVMEKQRGITIFSHPAVMPMGDDLQVTLLDTPGHVDFVPETERALEVLDYAILIVSAVDGIQGHTQTLWRLLRAHHIPTMIVINKIDMVGSDVVRVVQQLRQRWSPGCVDCTKIADAYEDIAMLDDHVLERYLADGSVSEEAIARLVSKCALFPCFALSALKMQGIDRLLDGLRWYTRSSTDAQLQTTAVTSDATQSEFGARVYKISHDEQGNRLAWMKVTSGVVHAKAMVGGEKIDQLRWYSGAKFTTVESLAAGNVCAVTGLHETVAGQGLGVEACESDGAGVASLTLQPVLVYSVSSQNSDAHHLLTALRELEDEDPLLRVSWVARLQEIHIHVMGEVQLTILQQRLWDRYQLRVEFGESSIAYAETITKPVEGVGHFEPLRHYAEAHVLLEPIDRERGLQYATACSQDVLEKRYQELVLSHCREKEHVGPLIGAPIIDVRMTLVTGRAHVKHTEGGDFREATYRAIRQGLMQARAWGSCVLLEPWYAFTLVVPREAQGRAMADVQRMSGTSALVDGGSAVDVADVDLVTLQGEAPVSTMRDYALEVHAYTHGRGQLTCVYAGYQPCHNAEEVIDGAQYDAETDLENTPDSVFCAHGAGYGVKWYKVPEFMHCEYATPYGV